MVQVIKTENPQGRLADMLGMSLGQGIGNGLNTFFANRSLESVMKDKSLEGASQSKKMEAIRSALSPYGEKGQEIFQQRLQIDQQERNEAEQAKSEAQQDILSRVVSGEKVSPKEMSKLSPENQLKITEFQKKLAERERGEAEQEVLGRIVSGGEVSPKEMGKLSPENQLKVMDLKKRREAGKSVLESLVKAGYPEETAKIWQMQMENAPVGGQSDVIKNVNDLIRRSKAGKGLGQEQETKEQVKPNIDIPGTNLGALDLDFPELPEPIGMTPSDIVKQNEYREKTNTPLYNETVDRLNALDDEYREVKHLQELNQIPGALPTGVDKWNVNWDTGDLRVKALATPETQDYVKTIARMARRAKDFFPGRVTNFDLDQFKQGFPTLANSPEGRKLIAEQLALGNRIAYLKDETFKASLDHYGSGADPVLVKKFATENYRRLKSQLEDQLKSVNSQARSMTKQESQKSERPPLSEIWK